MRLYSVDDSIINERGTVGRREDEVLRKKPAPVPLFPPHIPHDLTSDQSLATVVGRHLWFRNKSRYEGIVCSILIIN
jgi:hypothetical protein